MKLSNPQQLILVEAYHKGPITVRVDTRRWQSVRALRLAGLVSYSGELVSITQAGRDLLDAEP